MKEVSDAAGFERSRSADFISIALWPSRGLAINGIELKRSRGDWLGELKNPDKAENIFQYCDHFYLLTENSTIAKLEEIPATWGWMNIKNEKIQYLKDAPKLTPKPVSKSFLAALLKRAENKDGYIYKSEIEDRITTARAAGRQELQREYDMNFRKLTELTNDVSAFEKSSGINLKGHYRWQTSATKIGEAVRFIEDGGLEKLEKDLLKLEFAAKIIYDEIIKGLEFVKADKTNQVSV